MGLFSSLFGGGGGTSVQQQAANKTEVNIDNKISNIIDLSSLAKAIKSTSQQTRDLITQLSKAQILTQLADVQTRINQNNLIKKSLKFVGTGAVIWFLWRKIYG